MHPTNSTSQLVPSLLRNKGSDIASFYDYHDRSSMKLKGLEAGRGLGICNGSGTFGVAYPIELLLNCISHTINRMRVTESYICAYLKLLE